MKNSPKKNSKMQAMSRRTSSDCKILQKINNRFFDYFN